MPLPLTVVVLSYNRGPCLLETVAALRALPEAPRVLVVDNHSTDGTPARLRQRFPDVQLIALAENRGAAGRNVGLRAATTPYVALCDDDTRWAPGALTRACALLDATPDLAVLAARVLVGDAEIEDPTCRLMAQSPLPRATLPGPALVGFMAGACVVRKDPVLAVGGFESRLFIGGEEALLALDLLDAGWRICYCEELTVHHYPSNIRDAAARRRLLLRNAIWVALLRRAPTAALAATARALREAAAQDILWPVLRASLRGLKWTLRARRRLDPRVEQMLKLLERDPAPAALVTGEAT
jgi:GT2 family glycosyltransferase